MIKNLSLLIFLYFMHATHADQLSDAIHASDLQKVTMLLSTSTVTTKQLAKYFDTAEQVIRTRRNKMDAKVRPSDDYHISNRTGIASCMTIACFISTPISVFKALENEYNLKFFFGSMVSLSISAISMAVCSGLDKEVYRKHCQNLYKDAIRIKELLYDYELSLSDIKE